MATFDFGTKYEYKLITSMSMYDHRPSVILKTDHRANSKAFKADVKRVTRETGHNYSRYENMRSAVYRIGVIC